MNDLERLKKLAVEYEKKSEQCKKDSEKCKEKIEKLIEFLETNNRIRLEINDFFRV